MNKGAATILMDIIKDGYEEEKEHAVKCIWELSFDKSIKEEFKGDNRLRQLLGELQSSSRESISKAADGAMWQIGAEEGLDNDSSRAEIRSGGGRKGSVMLSYHWADQQVALKVADSLRKRGYKVWMDIDNMEGSTLQAMAEAVQNASVVLVFMSERYKLSQNCRSEAEYAFDLRKTIVPLLIQKAYKPDGWLGLIARTLNFMDFTGKYLFDQKMSDLVKSLGKLLR
ncbi:uncharacterized protein LOC124131333 isoform X2 [Haliotis rufescens]|uniref:uncharacterized protein LOC124131333 isoform X2 n=1 Tax=Haliotis rufescens TaxID=6454 RepID=UPI00201E964B|nr:uncharacterized protein LOC124131333 isoform X2 [Haliotis rufescens]